MDELKLSALTEVAKLLNNTIKKQYEVVDFQGQEVISNHLFKNEEVQLIKRKLLKIISEV